MKALEALKTRLLEVDDLNGAANLLYWDQTTYMPPGGAPARGRQLATLGKLSHEKFTDPTIGKLLDDLRSYEDSQPHDSDDAALIRVTRRNYEKATKVPTAWLADFITHTTACYEAWTKARPANDFKAVQPLL